MARPITLGLTALAAAALVLLVILTVQLFAARGELAELRDQLTTIGSEVRDARTTVEELRTRTDQLEAGVPLSELSLRMGELENDIRRWVVAFSGEVEPGAVGGGGDEEVREQLEVILEEIAALNSRLDEICAGVPVC